MKKITIFNLKQRKTNIENDQIRKLEYKLKVNLPNKQMQLQETVEKLKLQLAPQFVQNSMLVGDYIVYDHPVKPKKKLIVLVALISGLILSIFFVFLLEFFRGFKEETQEKV